MPRKVGLARDRRQPLAGRARDHRGRCADWAGRDSLTIMRPILLVLPLTCLAACVEVPTEVSGARPPVVDAALPTPEARPDLILDPTPPPPPPIDAITVEALDTTTEEDRAAALATPVSVPAGLLGTTTATLGPPSDPGIWLETPLVSEVTPGRVNYGANGRSANVELRPSGGEPGSGSQISLAAIRLLEAPLTGILELDVSSS